jgi:hypothetical protein
MPAFREPEPACRGQFDDRLAVFGEARPWLLIVCSPAKFRYTGHHAAMADDGWNGICVR